jgi:hypothetical protein
VGNGICYPPYVNCDVLATKVQLPAAPAPALASDCLLCCDCFDGAAAALISGVSHTAHRLRSGLFCVRPQQDQNATHVSKAPHRSPFPQALFRTTQVQAGHTNSAPAEATLATVAAAGLGFAPGNGVAHTAQTVRFGSFCGSA